jgi:hypothetical protein
LALHHYGIVSCANEDHQLIIKFKQEQTCGLKEKLQSSQAQEQELAQPLPDYLPTKAAR